MFIINLAQDLIIPFIKLLTSILIVNPADICPNIPNKAEFSILKHILVIQANINYKELNTINTL